MYAVLGLRQNQMKDIRVRVFEKKMLRNMFGPNRNKEGEYKL